MHITRLPKMLIQSKDSKGLKKQRRPSQASRAATSSTTPLGTEIPKGHLAVYVGNNRHMSRFVIPIVYLNHPLFQSLLRKVEEEFGFEHPMGGLTLPCAEDDFLSLVSQLSGY